MISVLSGVVLMMAIGTVVQRGDVLAEFFGHEAEPVVLSQDVVELDAGTLARIDVLANDTGISDRAADRLVILEQPDCGRVFVQGGALQLLADKDCAAEQRIVYGLSDEESGVKGEVLVTVRGARPAAKSPAPAKPAPSQENVPVASVEPKVATPRPQPAANAPAAPRQVQDDTAIGLAAAPQLDSGVNVARQAPAVGAPAASAPRVAAPQSPQPALQGAAPADTSVIAGTSGLSGDALQAPSAPRAPGGASPTTLVLSSPSAAAPVSPRAPQPSAPGGAGQLGGQLAPAAPAPAQPGSTAPSVPRQVASLGGRQEPAAPAAPTGLQGVAQPDTGSITGSGLASATGADTPLDRGIAGGIAQDVTATVALARVEVPEATAAPSTSRALGLDLSGPSGGIAPMGPPVSRIDATAGQAVALAEPSAGLGEILSFGDPLVLRPIDTNEPTALAEPSKPAQDEDIQRAALEPAGEVGVPGATGENQPAPLPKPEKVAALPQIDLRCTVPPSITLDIRPAGETELIVTSPCHADSIAELSYEGLHFGLRIDRSGRGNINALGFESSSEAILAFADGETLEFSLPFTGTDRIERVALAWDAPVTLDLHALEFGAALAAEGHVHPGAPRSFREVRRRGGGFISAYEPVEGVGQSVQFYSHWLRRGGQTGVVKLYIDFASRHRDKLAGTCGGGALSRPSFTVVRAARGRIEAPIVRRLASMDCDSIENAADHLIGAAVRDIIISQR